jgi:hypothetical protein
MRLRQIGKEINELKNMNEEIENENENENENMDGHMDHMDEEENMD